MRKSDVSVNTIHKRIIIPMIEPKPVISLRCIEKNANASRTGFMRTTAAGTAPKRAIPDEKKLSRKNILLSFFLGRDVDMSTAHSLLRPSKPIRRLLTDPMNVIPTPKAIAT